MEEMRNNFIHEIIDADLAENATAGDNPKDTVNPLLADAELFEYGKI